MNEQLRNLLLIGGLIGVGYVAFNRYTSDALPLKFICKLAQEIKHQMLIVTINYAQGCRQNINKIKQTDKSKLQNLTTFFRSKLVQIYAQKQDLILGKYSIPKQRYAQSLEAHRADKKLQKIQEQILKMMEKSIQGETPDLTVDKRAATAFTKEQIRTIYEDMSKMILVALVAKLQNQKKNNPYFDSNNDAQFKKVIRQLNIYDKKIQFFKQRGFKQEWGCPNQTFFKISQSLKLSDPEYKNQMRRLQQIYQKAVDVVALKPEQITMDQINQFYVPKPEPKPQPQNPIELLNEKNSQPGFITTLSSKIVQNSQSQPIVVEEVQQQVPINLNASTKSEPEVVQQKPKTEVFESIVSEVIQQPNQIKIEVSQVKISQQPAEEGNSTLIVQIQTKQVQISVQKQVQEQKIEDENLSNEQPQQVTNVTQVQQVQKDNIEQAKQEQVNVEEPLKQEEATEPNANIEGQKNEEKQQQPQPQKQKQEV